MEAAKEEFMRAYSLSGKNSPELLALDLLDEKKVTEAAEHIVSKYGRVDLLFNGAGISIPGTLEQDVENVRYLVCGKSAGAVFVDESHYSSYGETRRGQNYQYGVTKRQSRCFQVRRIFRLKIRLDGA